MNNVEERNIRGNSNEEMINSVNLEYNKDKTIKEYIQKKVNKEALKISVVNKGNIKINYMEGNYLKYEIEKSPEEKMSNIIGYYYKMKGIKNENKISFLCGGDILTPEEIKNKQIKNYIQKGINENILKILVYI